MAEKKIPRCYTCHMIVSFDPDMVGRNGKLIPLDLATHQPHRCPEDKNEWGRAEQEQEQQQAPEPKPQAAPPTHPHYMIHRVKIVLAPEPQLCEDRTNAALADYDMKGFIHRGTTFKVVLIGDDILYLNEIHYEIPPTTATTATAE